MLTISIREIYNFDTSFLEWFSYRNSFGEACRGLSNYELITISESRSYIFKITSKSRNNLVQYDVTSVFHKRRNNKFLKFATMAFLLL